MLFFVVGVGSENFVRLSVYRLTTFVFKYRCSVILSCSFEFVVGGWWVFGDYRVSPNFLVLGLGLGLGLWLRLWLGCDNWAIFGGWGWARKVFPSVLI